MVLDNRKIVLDTETTGLDPLNDRIIEIGCIELINDIPSGEKLHHYFNPGNRIISDQAEQIHGLNSKFLSSFSQFEAKAQEIVKFLSDSEIIIHNVAFDLEALNAHLRRANLDIIKKEQCKCTLELAKKMFPGSKVNLNALCRRYDINLDSREKHGALTDCFLLAQVYLELTGGRQSQLKFDSTSYNNIKTQYEPTPKSPINFETMKKIEISEEEENKHKELVKRIPNSIWNNF